MQLPYVFLEERRHLPILVLCFIPARPSPDLLGVGRGQEIHHLHIVLRLGLLCQREKYDTLDGSEKKTLNDEGQSLSTRIVKQL